MISDHDQNNHYDDMQNWIVFLDPNQQKEIRNAFSTSSQDLCAGALFDFIVVCLL